ncbi:HEPN domain-containing protein [Pseudomonas oryzihabitans]|uniref:HEPN domain-containing protein n=1 Tax=Pseudomonas oryzihabitans TaxID=47885 RepID=UPI0025574113|nr:HEPN domain-containing protein [Pseudomonas oryzihabitans]MDK8264935.1 HEPN domain-containing protein [Pseudomonas oryzihabitans]
MSQADLDGPLQDFKERTKQIREVVAAVEAVGKTPAAVRTARPSVDFNNIGAQTGNTANSMALIFLASTFEEFVRELTTQCANELMDKYSSFPDARKHSVRESYWKASREQLKHVSILSNKAPDATLIAKLRGALEAQHGFVVENDPTKLSVQVFPHHSNNFKPGVVVDIMARLGISKLIETMAEHAKLKTYFGVTKKEDCCTRTKTKWTEFYDRRNETVHSLGGTTGFAIEVIFDYIEFLELVAESMKVTVGRAISAW